MIIQRDPGLWGFVRFDQHGSPTPTPTPAPDTAGLATTAEIDAVLADAASGDVNINYNIPTSERDVNTGRLQYVQLITAAKDAAYNAMVLQGYDASNPPDVSRLFNRYIKELAERIGPTDASLPQYVHEQIAAQVPTVSAFVSMYNQGEFSSLVEGVSRQAQQWMTKATETFRDWMAAHLDDDADTEWARIVNEIVPDNYQDEVTALTRPTYTAEVGVTPLEVSAQAVEFRREAENRFLAAMVADPAAGVVGTWRRIVNEVVSDEAVASHILQGGRPPTLAELRAGEDTFFVSDAAADAHALLRQKAVERRALKETLSQADYDQLTANLNDAEKADLAQFWIQDASGNYDTNLDSGGPGGPRQDNGGGRLTGVFTAAGGADDGSGGGGATLRDQATWLQAEVAAGKLTLDEAKFTFQKTIDERNQARADAKLEFDRAGQRLDRDEAFLTAGVVSSRDRDDAFLAAARISLPMDTKYAPGFGPGETVGQLEKFAGATPSNVQTEVIPFNPGAIAATALDTFESRQGLA